MSASIVSRFPGSLSEVDYDQLIKTKEAMNMKKISGDCFYGMKKSLKIESFNYGLHKKMTYHVLKSLPSVSVFVLSPNFYRLPHFPRFKISSKKQKAIYKIGGLPIEIIRIINEYVFQRFDEVCYSLFYLSIEVYNIIKLDICVMNSISRKTIDLRINNEDNIEDPRNEEDPRHEKWEWVNVKSSLRMSARNCYFCGGYKNSNTVGISPRVRCRCNITNV